MDVEAFKPAFELASNALSLLKQIKDLLPNSPKKKAAEKTLSQAEKAFKLAEAQIA